MLLPDPEDELEDRSSEERDELELEVDEPEELEPDEPELEPLDRRSE